MVTIGIPVYNGMARIERAIESVHSQTYQHIQIVISDNGSSDGTEAICWESAEKSDRKTFLNNPENLGATKNFKVVYQA